MCAIAMTKSGSRLCILAWNEFYYRSTRSGNGWANSPRAKSWLSTARDFIDARARGMGGSDTDPYCSCAEENLLCYPGDPYSTENILIHELAHNIHLRGMANVDPQFVIRCQASYDAAMKAGLWRGKYAA